MLYLELTRAKSSTIVYDTTSKLVSAVKRWPLSVAVKRCQLSAAVSCQCVIDVLDTLDSARTWSQLFSVKRCQALSMTLLSMSIDSSVRCQLAVNDTD